MNAHGHSRWLAFKALLAFLLIFTAFQSVSIHGLAAGVTAAYGLQDGGVPEPLVCSGSPTSNCDIQLILLIDDSGSMRTNDRDFSRNEGAKNLVDILDRQYYSPAWLLHSESPDFRVPNIQVSVIHFTNEVVAASDWILFDGPGKTSAWKTKLNEQIDIIKNRPGFYRKVRATNFIAPFNKASELFSLTKGQTSEGGCIRRSVMLFTDGTPEDPAGIPSPDVIKQQMDNVQDIVKGFQDPLSEQDKVGILVTGFKVNPNYWDPVKGYWNTIATYAQPKLPGQQPARVELKDTLVGLLTRMEATTAALSDIQNVALPNSAGIYTGQVPAHAQSVRFTLYNLDPAAKLTITDPNGKIVQQGPGVTVQGKDQLIEVWQLENPLPGKYSIQVTAAQPGGTVTELVKYQNLSAEFNSELGPFSIGKPVSISFQLLDDSGNPVLPSDGYASSALKVSPSLTPDGIAEKKAINWKQDGNNYLVSWTPVNEGEYQFGIDISLVNAQGNPILNCSNNWRLAVPRDPGGSSKDSISMVVGPSEAPKNNTITVPIKINYEGKGVVGHPISWTTSVKPDNRSAYQPPVQIIDESQGRYKLVIDPVDDATLFDVQLTANPLIDGDRVPPLKADFTIKLDGNGCAYTGPWLTWFWPLVILLALALLVLLLFRLRYERSTETDRDRTTRTRVRYWQLLFLPFALLLLLAVLNRVWWCYTIPLWAFLVAILVMVLLTLPIRFMPWETGSRSASWWLVALLAVIGLLLVASLIFNASLLWLSLVVVSAAVVRWALYHILFYIPDHPIVSLVMTDSCVPPGETITLALQLNDEEHLGWFSTLQWEDPVITAQPGGDSVKAKIETVDADSGQYRLAIDSVRDVQSLDVSVHGKAKVDGQDVDIDARATMMVCAPEHEPHDGKLVPFITAASPLTLSMVVPPACVPERELIRLPLHLDHEGDQDWYSTLQWTQSVMAEPEAKVVPADVNVIDAKHGDYELCIDPVIGAEWISVQVAAKVKIQGQEVTVSASAAGIEICPTDDLKDLEGIGVAVEQLLHRHNIFTFADLAGTKWKDIEEWLNQETENKEPKVKNSYWGKMMNPKTWPQQAELRNKAKKTGREKDWKSYLDYKAWLFDGIEPDEYATPEKADRRPDALKWPDQKQLIPEADIEAAQERFRKKMEEARERREARETKNQADES